MLSLELLQRHSKQVHFAIRELFKAAIQNQTHRNDILIVTQNGFYDEKVKRFDEGYSPFVFGPNDIGHAEHTQYEFYDAYRKQYFKGSIKDYISSLKKDRELKDRHCISVQLELMIYQKFFESEGVLKKLYQLCRLAGGLEYDWYFEVKKYKEETNGGRSKLIWKEIKSPIKNICPLFYKLLDETYKSQIRNASAHSQFYFLGEHIILTNYQENKWSDIYSISFEQWNDRIHKVILIFNELIAFYSMVENYFNKTVQGKHFGHGLRITTKENTLKYQHIRINELNGSWIWYNAYKKHYL